MLTKVTETKRTIKAKGTIVNVDDAGVHIEDVKTGEISVLTLDTFKLFLDKEISFSISDSDKEEETVEEV